MCHRVDAINYTKMVVALQLEPSPGKANFASELGSRIYSCRIYILPSHLFGPAHHTYLCLGHRRSSSLVQRWYSPPVLVCCAGTIPVLNLPPLPKTRQVVAKHKSFFFEETKR